MHTVVAPVETPGAFGDRHHLVTTGEGVDDWRYVLEVTIHGPIDRKTGMVMDLKALKDLLVREIVDRVDHKNLNIDVDFLQGIIPTAENMVACFWELVEEKLPVNCRLYEMRLWETDNNVAIYRGEGAEVHKFE